MEPHNYDHNEFLWAGVWIKWKAKNNKGEQPKDFYCDSHSIQMKAIFRKRGHS